MAFILTKSINTGFYNHNLIFMIGGAVQVGFADIFYTFWGNGPCHLLYLYPSQEMLINLSLSLKDMEVITESYFLIKNVYQ